MPIYEYRCEGCAHVCEVKTDTPEQAVRCPDCGAWCRRVWTPVNFTIT